MRGCLGCILCQIRLMLSLKVDEFKPLPARRFLSVGGNRRIVQDGGTQAGRPGCSGGVVKAKLESS
jgi:hypothetical protein